MRLFKKFAFLAALALFSAASVTAQNSAVESLRSQLRDLDTREGELQTRARQLDEDLKPENIEKYYALNGSTRPEELREQRRRQLEKERDGVRTQLDQLASSRTRLQASLAAAEAAAYRQSAQPPDSYTAPASVNPSAASSNSPAVKPKPAQQPAQRRARQRRRTKRRG